MLIKRGIIQDNADTSKSGVIKIKDIDTNEDNLEMKYSSPYFMRNEGGVVAIPEPGAEILYAVDDTGTGELHYITTIVNQPTSIGLRNKNVNVPLIINKDRLYSKEGVPQAICFKDSNNAGLTVSNLSDKKDGIECRVELRSMGNHRFVLSENPSDDAVLIKNSDGDGIRITTRSDYAPNNSILSYCNGPQWHTVNGSEYNIDVINGRDINIKNDSFGDMAPPNATKQAGNINLITTYRDINLFAEGADGAGGNIFITTAKNTIQITAAGEVNIFSGGNIHIIGDNDINIKAYNNLNLEGKNVNIKSNQGATQIKSDTNLKIESAGEASIKGSTIQLNNPGDAGVNFNGVSDPGRVEDAYGR